MTQRTIPGHLRWLSRDPRTGWPGPWINQWTSEADEHAVTVGSFHGKPAFCQPESYGVGEVDFTHQHMNRQRELMYERECQVCRSLDAKILVLGDLSGAVAEVSGRWWVLLNEPFLCAKCADFALSHCPGLIRRKRDDRLAIVTPGDVTMILSAGYHDTQPGVAAVIWAKYGIPLAEFRGQGIEDLLHLWMPD